MYKKLTLIPIIALTLSACVDQDTDNKAMAPADTAAVTAESEVTTSAPEVVAPEKMEEKTYTERSKEIGKAVTDLSKDLGKDIADKSREIYTDIRDNSGEYTEKAADKSKELYEAAKEIGSEYGGVIKEKSKELYETVKDKAGDAYEKGKDKMEEMKKEETNKEAMPAVEKVKI